MRNRLAGLLAAVCGAGLPVSATVETWAQAPPAAAGSIEAVSLFPDDYPVWGRATNASYGRDADEVVFVVWPAAGQEGRPRILSARRTATGWTDPAYALPETGFFVEGPSISPDGRRLFFETTLRSPAAPDREDTDAWVAERQGDDWGPARPVGPPFDSPFNEHNVTVSKRETICFNSSRPDGLGENDLYCAERHGATWQVPLNLGAPVNTRYLEAVPFLDPDERFILFGSDRPGGFGQEDLYISVWKDGRWTAPVNLGPGINTEAMEWSPSVSPDGRRLLFTRVTGEGAERKRVLYEIPFDPDLWSHDPDASKDAGPGPRSSHTLLFHEGLGKMVLLDGYQPPFQPVPTDIWMWDGRQWEAISGPGPRSRALSAAVYDARRHRIVSHGGICYNDQFLGDTWEWDGREWQLVANDTLKTRDHHAMTYDTKRARTILFGGFLPGFELPTEISEWDGRRWTGIAASGPAGRSRLALVYDPIRENTVLFGGLGADKHFFNDTWTWDGRVWQEVGGEGPAPRYAHAMTFDGRAGVVLLYGGETFDRKYDDLWQWDGRRWTEITMTGPTPGYRYSPALAYDPTREVVVLYGGMQNGRVIDDTWEWDGRRWSCRAGCDPGM